MMTPAGRQHLDQLRLEDAIDPKDRRPWNGRSPRMLTRAHEMFSFVAVGGDAEPIFDEEVLEEQFLRHQEDPSNGS